uniref:Uncharacterized protein n=1 Tax=viral metagenome TaxID=1070528 RepID=A0A6M3LCF6_9ZZZZ
MSQTIKKTIGQGWGKGDLYNALAYDATDKFGGLKIKALMLNSTGRISFLDANAYIYSSVTTQLDLVATTIALAGITTVTGATTITGALTVGVSGTGHDVKFFGDTAGCSLLYDQSEDQLVITQTNAATTGTERTLDVSQTHTGIGASAEALRSVITTNVAGGTYMNAVFGKIDFSTVGKVTGLAGVICAELTMAGGAVSQGTYATFEAEINLPTSYSSSVPISVLRIGTWGAVKTSFDTYGYLLDIDGPAVGSGKFFQVNTAAAATHALRVRIGGVAYYVMLTDTGA